MNIKQNEPLAKYTNFRIGGPAKVLVEVKTEEELMQALEIAQKERLPSFVLGGGSNTLASEKGFDGIVIKMAMRNVRISGTEVTAEAGAISAGLARTTADAGLRGWQWAISLPGTIGGAVRGNAGCFGGETADCFVSAKILRDGKVVEMKKEEMQFGYRDSVLKHQPGIVLSATFALTKDDPATLKAEMDAHLAKRKSSQPLYAGSAGCIFKNPPDGSAGRLIDELGLKGKTIGRAQISPEHGNFIVNLGGATASDVIQLIALAKTAARDQLGIQLHEEVEYLGF